MTAHEPLPHDGAAHSAGDHEHPGSGVYIRVAIVLAIVTAVEVVIYYLDAVRPILVPALILLSVGKFIAVVGFFMHLRFDDKRFTWLFGAGLALSVSVFLALLAMTLTGGYFAPVLRLPE